MEPKQNYTFSSPTYLNEQQIGVFKHVSPISIQQTDHSKAHLPPFGSRRGLLDLRTETGGSLHGCMWSYME